MLVGIYVALGYYVRPEPDMTDLGWFGGLLNDPFRYRDNINRQLLFFQIVLLPGRLLAEGMIWLIGRCINRDESI